MKRKPVLLSVIFAMLLQSCGGGGGGQSTIPAAVRLSSLDSVSVMGVFDPSVSRDPATNRLWMSYSAVDPSALYDPAVYWGVSIRLAYSDDNGDSWTDAGLIADFTEHSGATFGSPTMSVSGSLPAINNDSIGIWQNEISTLIYDPSARNGEQWKLIWFQYLHANDTSYFLDYGWLAMKAASSPAGLVNATPVKLFAGFGLSPDGQNISSPVFSPIGGAPLVRLNADLIQAATGVNLNELDNCVFAEPSLFATNSAIYLTSFCSDVLASQQYIVHFRCASPCDMTAATSWEYLGRLMTPADAASATGRDHFQAPALVQKNAFTYLLVTPVEVLTSGSAAVNRYDGCRLYRFADLDSNNLTRDSGGQLLEYASISGQAGSHHGACAMIDGLQRGILLSQHESANTPDTFRIYKSQIPLP